MRWQPRAAHKTAVPVGRSHPAVLAPTHLRRSPAAASPDPIHLRAVPASRTPRHPLATPGAATEGARETTLQTAFACASRDQSPQFSTTVTFPLLGTPSLSR